MDEHRRVEEGATWYLREQLDFDKRLVRFRYRSLQPHFTGRSCLELGPADGIMTEWLVKAFERVTVVDAAQELLDAIPRHPRLRKVCRLFEEYDPGERFDTVLLEHILEHVLDPTDLLRRAASWVAPGGRLLAGVPNALSFHRLAAVKMGLLVSPTDLNERDRLLGHRRVYTRETFAGDLAAAGLAIEEMGGVFFKPLSNRQIQEQWTDAMIEGFYLLGKDFPEHAAELYAVCRRP
jgi:2-polyprenyl-3-methyl-5-hydroxy-6-metoxy-1,4-benzoquinol methylase